MRSDLPVGSSLRVTAFDRLLSVDLPRIWGRFRWSVVQPSCSFFPCFRSSGLFLPVTPEEIAIAAFVAQPGRPVVAPRRPRRPPLSPAQPSSSSTSPRLDPAMSSTTPTLTAGSTPCSSSSAPDGGSCGGGTRHYSSLPHAQPDDLIYAPASPLLPPPQRCGPDGRASGPAPSAAPCPDAPALSVKRLAIRAARRPRHFFRCRHDVTPTAVLRLQEPDMESKLKASRMHIYVAKVVRITNLDWANFISLVQNSAFQLRHILENGKAYAVEGDAYFSVDTYPEYLCLSGRKLDDNLAGVEFAVDTREQNPADFALWKESDSLWATLSSFEAEIGSKVFLQKYNDHNNSKI